MKALTLSLLVTIGLTNHALAATKVWDCDSSSDPDYTDISIFEENDKLYMVLNEFYGDGDSYDEDVIVVERIAQHDADHYTFVQVPGKYPKSSLAKKATKKTQGVVLKIKRDKTKTSLDAEIVGLSGPSGNELNDNWLSCEKVN